ncbi:MAG: DUF3822 family protein [Bacteroidales bacterium]|nr:DUF3822 family protein [Bacteroidales bacterium]
MEAYKIVQLVKVEDSIVSNETRLSICLKANGFSFSLIDNKSLKLLCIGEFEVDTTGSIPQVMNRIRECFSSICIKIFKFAKTRIICETTKNVWVPYKLYDQTKNKEYIKTVSNLLSNETVIANTSEKLDAISIFAYPMHTYSGVKILMPNAEYCCQHQIMAEYAYDITKFSQNTLLVNKRENACDVVLFKGNSFVLSNSFEYQNSADLIYFILFTLQQLSVDTAEVKTLLTGADYTKEELTLLRKYIKDVSFSNPMENIKVGCEFDSINLQNYFLVIA